MSASVSYVSAACNHVPCAADWGKNGLICYAACNAVLIYDPHIGGGKIIHSLVKHTDRVNAVCWIADDELVSVSSDKTAIIWSFEHKVNNYQPIQLKAHSDVVTCVHGLHKYETKQLIICTASSDSTICIWNRKHRDVDVDLIQTLNLGYNIAISIKTTLVADKVLIAVGNNQSKIQLWVEDDCGVFHMGAVLAGHEDWVTGLDFQHVNGELVYLASSSQDHSVRIWRFVQPTTLEDTSIQIQQLQLAITTESVLYGHEGWVYSVKWFKNKLLSASLDKTIVIWEHDANAAMWLESDRVGEIGGNTLGFYGACWSADGMGILAHSYHGAFHMWRFYEAIGWEPQVTIGGHFRQVTDLAWDPQGHYLMSVSADQTCRIHGEWNESTWHELARPQVHGFDLQCVSIINEQCFASGAEEKITRVFQAPQTFLRNFSTICGIELVNEIDLQSPKGASLPSLGLSNKAIFHNEDKPITAPKTTSYPEESHFVALELQAPATEENLLQNTLWPETQKLYGHGYELQALAAAPDGSLLASACRATTLEHAAIILWNTHTWQIEQKLYSHTLTVAQLQFAPDSKSLLSVSRDRRWSVFSKNDASGQFELSATTHKERKLAVHARIIWCCGWTGNSMYFATGSRDGKVAVWPKEANNAEIVAIAGKPVRMPLALGVLDIKEAVTALTFDPEMIDNIKYRMAIGTEAGRIHIYTWSVDKEFQHVLAMDHGMAHHLTVRRLAFRPRNVRNCCQLASCGNDHSVRVYNIFE